eukprot:470896_1
MSQKLCRYGNNCRYYQQGRCYFYHPPQNNQHNTNSYETKNESNNYYSKSDDAFNNYPSKPKIIANPRTERTFDQSLIQKGIKFIRYVYSFGIIGYKLDATSNKYVYLTVQHKYNKEWGFPKGHFDKTKESNNGYNTAKREFIEETGIQFNTNNIISIDWNNPFILNYEFIRNNKLCKKWTVLFIANLSNNATPKITHPQEINNIQFLTFEKFNQKVIHQKIKNILTQFHQTLHTNINVINDENKNNFEPSNKRMKLSNIEENILIILRGFPGAGKSTLTKAIIGYYGELNCISCSYDKYHWSGKQEGNGVFKFDYNIHKDTKKWCKEEIYESMKKYVKVIIIDNGNFEIWEYSKYIKWAKEYKYKVLIIEIKSENKNMKRIKHIQHLNNKNESVNECYLCIMQGNRCKMDIPNNAMIRFIQKWEVDENCVLVEPKLDKNDKWNNQELKSILNNMKSAECFEYPEDNWNGK